MVVALDDAEDVVDVLAVSAELAVVVAVVVATEDEDELVAELVDAEDVVETDAADELAGEVEATEALPLLTVPDAVVPQLASASATAWVAPSTSTFRLVRIMPLVFPPCCDATRHRYRRPRIATAP